MTLTITSTIPGGCNGTDMRLRDPSGNQIAYANIGNGSNFIDTVTLPADGTYTAFIDVGGTNTGTFTVEVDSVAPDATASTTIDGPAAQVTTTTAGQNAAATFPGSANQRVTLTITSTIPGGCNGTDMRLRDPSGNQIAYANIGNGSNFIDTVTLPADGTATAAFIAGGIGIAVGGCAATAVPTGGVGCAVAIVSGGGLAISAAAVGIGYYVELWKQRDTLFDYDHCDEGSFLICTHT